MAVQFQIMLLCCLVSCLMPFAGGLGGRCPWFLPLAGIPSVVMLVGLVWVAATLSYTAALLLLGWEGL